MNELCQVPLSLWFPVVFGQAKDPIYNNIGSLAQAQAPEVLILF